MCQQDLKLVVRLRAPEPGFHRRWAADRALVASSQVRLE